MKKFLKGIGIAVLVATCVFALAACKPKDDLAGALNAENFKDNLKNVKMTVTTSATGESDYVQVRIYTDAGEYIKNTRVDEDGETVRESYFEYGAAGTTSHLRYYKNEAGEWEKEVFESAAERGAYEYFDGMLEKTSKDDYEKDGDYYALKAAKVAEIMEKEADDTTSGSIKFKLEGSKIVEFITTMTYTEDDETFTYTVKIALEYGDQKINFPTATLV